MSSQLDQIVNECKSILAQCMISANQAAAAAASIGTAGLAPLQSPAFTGTPTAPTPDVGDGSTRVATTAFLARLLAQPNGVATLDGNGLVPLSELPFSGLVYDGTWNAQTNSPTLSSGSGISGHFYVVTVAGSTTLDGNSTWAVGDWALFSGVHWGRIPVVSPPLSNIPLSSLAGQASNTVVANTLGGSASPTAVAISSLTPLLSLMTGDAGAGGAAGLVPAPPPGATGSGAFLRADGIWHAPVGADLSGYAPLNSPAFTGTPTTATPARNTNSTAIATTQFVLSQLASGTGQAMLVQANSGTAGQTGTSTYGAAIDHIHPNDVSRVAVAGGSATNLAVSGSSTVSGTLTVTALMAISGAMNITGALTNGTMTVTGTATINALSVTKVNGSALGSAAFLNGGTGAVASQLVQLNASGILPALNASLLTNVPGISIVPAVQIVTTTGASTITIPSNATKCKVTLQGGGAGSTNTQGTGGGGGALIKYLTGLTPGNTLSLSVAASSTSNGNNTTLSSGTQSITTLTASGGIWAAGASGSGGTATNGDLNIPGGDGQYLTGAIFGGASFMSNIANIGGNSTVNGKNYGGGSAASSAIGSAGAQGCAIFEWYS